MNTPTQYHDAEKCYAKSRQYLYGTKSIEPNYALGEAYLEQAAELGSVQAMYDLAVLHLMTAVALNIIPADTEKGLRFLRKAADAGLASASVWLGCIHMKGDRVPADYAQARHHFEVAFNGGDPQGLYYQGQLTEKGLGMPTDLTAALALYQRAAKLGDEEAKRSAKRLKKQLAT